MAETLLGGRAPGPAKPSAPPAQAPAAQAPPAQAQPGPSLAAPSELTVPALPIGAPATVRDGVGQAPFGHAQAGYSHPQAAAWPAPTPLPPAPAAPPHGALPYGAGPGYAAPPGSYPPPGPGPFASSGRALYAPAPLQGTLRMGPARPSPPWPVLLTLHEVGGVLMVLFHLLFGFVMLTRPLTARGGVNMLLELGFAAWCVVGAVWVPLNLYALRARRTWAWASALVYALVSLPTAFGTPFGLFAGIVLAMPSVRAALQPPR